MVTIYSSLYIIHSLFFMGQSSSFLTWIKRLLIIRQIILDLWADWEFGKVANILLICFQFNYRKPPKISDTLNNYSNYPEHLIVYFFYILKSSNVWKYYWWADKQCRIGKTASLEGVWPDWHCLFMCNRPNFSRHYDT